MLPLGKTLVEYLIKEGILPGERMCPKCNHPMRLWQSPSYADGCHWMCGHINKKNKRKCTKAMSVRTDTWFAESRLSLGELVRTLL